MEGVDQWPTVIAGLIADNLAQKMLGRWPIWRREWDSNPRYGFPHTRFPSVRLKPLGHLSRGPLLKAQG